MLRNSEKSYKIWPIHEGQSYKMVVGTIMSSTVRAEFTMVDVPRVKINVQSTDILFEL